MLTNECNLKTPTRNSAGVEDADENNEDRSVARLLIDELKMKESLLAELQRLLKSDRPAQ